MKLHDLAIIFILIILPISMILSSYVKNRVDTLNMQILYDQKLLNATYDTVIAYQKNTLNSSTSDLAMSKLRDIEASANAFFTALGENFNMSGHGKEGIEAFVPALVFTLYDGYYIYSPYYNTLDDEAKKAEENNGKNTEGNKINGLKPYVYYSCRYKNADCDIVINYSLDSYIDINGIVNNQAVNLNGYLLTTAQKISDNQAKYKETIINPETTIKEKALLVDENDNIIAEPNNIFEVKKENGVKYYKNGANVYMNLNSKGIKQEGKNIGNNNDQAVKYYNQAANLKNKINSTSLKYIKISDAIDEAGNKMFPDNNELLFKELDSTNKNIEDEDSEFNEHRFNIIKHSIERNLSIAITNYNNVSNKLTTEFKLPKLKDYEWERVLNNISVITFLQGLPIGGKIYSGHAIVNNTKNEDFVAKDSIYILTNDNIYHNIKDENLISAKLSGARGYLNTDFEIKNSLGGYYSPKDGATGCYNCVISSEKNSNKSIEEIMKNNPELAKIYYTALGRERYSMYRIGNHK